MLRRFAFASIIVLAGSTAWSQEEPGKDKKVEQLPIPRSVEEILPTPRFIMPQGNMLAPYTPSHPPQLGTREVWQYYGVDSTGRFRPRVIYSPQSAYYAINGQPYPWTTNRPNIYMPYAVD